MTIKKTHGGARPHPPGREGGRPKNQHPTRLLKIQATDEEWKLILEKLPNTRKRTEILLAIIKEEP